MKEEEEEDDHKEAEEGEDARGRERVKRTRRRATTMRRLRKVKEEENEREGGALGIRDPASPDKTALGAGATKAPEGARGVFFIGGEATEGEPLPR